MMKVPEFKGSVGSRRKSRYSHVFMKHVFSMAEYTHLPLHPGTLSVTWHSRHWWGKDNSNSLRRSRAHCYPELPSQWLFSLTALNAFNCINVISQWIIQVIFYDNSLLNKILVDKWCQRIKRFLSMTWPARLKSAVSTRNHQKRSRSNGQQQ